MILQGKKGRPYVGYSKGNERQKRKMSSEVSSEQENDTKLLIHGASISANLSKENDLNFILKKAASSPFEPSRMRKKITSNEKMPPKLS